jgi:signal transduction histidine kinase
MLDTIDRQATSRDLPFSMRHGARPHESEEALITSLLRTLSVFRIAALLWAVMGVALTRDELVREPLAWAFVAVMIATTALLTAPKGQSAILNPLATSTVVFEVVVGLAVLLADGFVYGADRPQSLPWSWPAAGVMAAGIVFGARAGLFTALLAGAASYTAEVLLLGRDNGNVGAISKLGLWVLTGTIAGYVVARLRRAEAEISVARAREEVVRELHDGVLQTLAVIQRRSSDTELAALARDQEHDLRGFLAGSGDEFQLAFEPAMRDLASRHERLYPNCKVHVVVAGDLPMLKANEIAALSGAVGEALTNSGKHANATKVTIYAEPADEALPAAVSSTITPRVFVSVKDDGTGFDTANTTESIGISSSIRGRLEDSGGAAHIDSAPGRGTEVQLWL